MTQTIFLKKDVLPQLTPGFVWSVTNPREGCAVYSYEVTVKETTVTILNAFKSSYLKAGCPKNLSHFQEDDFDKYLNREQFYIYYKYVLSSPVISYVNSSIDIKQIPESDIKDWLISKEEANKIREIKQLEWESKEASLQLDEIFKREKQWWNRLKKRWVNGSI